MTLNNNYFNKKGKKVNIFPFFCKKFIICTNNINAENELREYIIK